MKKLRNIFKANETLMQEALESGDTAQMTKFVGKSVTFASTVIRYANFSDMSASMMQLLVRDVTDEDWQKWNFKKDSRDALRRTFFSIALKSGRQDLVDVFLAEKIDMNTGRAEDHCFMNLCESPLPAEDKARVLDYLLARGIDKVTSPEAFLKKSAEHGYIDGFDAIKKRIDIDIHTDNEHLLRHAAGAGQVEFCLHLARAYGADIDVALITESTLGHQKAAQTLEQARTILNPDAQAAPSIAGLAAQVRVLERTVADLQANMRDITAKLAELLPQQRLDKRLPGPSPHR